MLIFSPDVDDRAASCAPTGEAVDAVEAGLGSFPKLKERRSKKRAAARLPTRETQHCK